MNDRILALTLHPEWAWAITDLDKRLENRSPAFAAQIARRVGDGWLAIHAGVKYPADLSGVCGMANAAGHVAEYVYSEPMVFADWWRFDDDIWIVDHHLVRGGIVALARLGEVLPPGVERPWKVTDSAAIVLADVVVLDEPIRCKGRQGLWTPADDVQAQLCAVIERIGGER